MIWVIIFGWTNPLIPIDLVLERWSRLRFRCNFFLLLTHLLVIYWNSLILKFVHPPSHLIKAQRRRQHRLRTTSDKNKTSLNCTSQHFDWSIIVTIQIILIFFILNDQKFGRRQPYKWGGLGYCPKL